MSEIKSFTGKYSFLSNFYPCKVMFEGVRYPSVEHAFQAAKTLDNKERINFSVMRTPATAKYFGRRIHLREDWEEVKDGVMLECLRAKFSNPTVKQLLLSTGDDILIEGNAHGDRYWGQVGGVGKNRLGELLMKVRNELNENN